MLVSLYQFLEDTYQDALDKTQALLETVKHDQDLFLLFLTILNQRLLSLDDLEFLGQKQNAQASQFLAPAQSKFAAQLLNKIAYRLHQSEQAANEVNEDLRDLLKSCVSRFYDRDRRLGLYPADFWIVDRSLLVQRGEPNLKNFNQLVLNNCQQTVPFEIRAYFFRQGMDKDKEERHNMFGFMHEAAVEIRREFILEDAFEKLYGLGADIRNRFRVQFVDLNYMQEEGIDGGGLFKEFMTKLTEVIFDPQYAFFSETHERKLFPNHLSKNLPDYLQ